MTINSAALSLLDDDPFNEPQLTMVPTMTSSGAAAATVALQPASPNGASRPRSSKPKPSKTTPTRRPALATLAGSNAASLPITPPTWTVAIIASVVASPALVQGLLRHTISMTTMFERWGLIALGCWAVSEVVRRYVAAAEAARTSAERSEIPAERSEIPAERSHMADINNQPKALDDSAALALLGLELTDPLPTDGP